MANMVVDVPNSLDKDIAIGIAVIMIMMKATDDQKYPIDISIIRIMYEIADKLGTILPEYCRWYRWI